MPIITAFPDEPNAQVRVEINWADVPSVSFAKVLRYNPATGECIPLRPYICYDGDYLRLSCGHGVFFDTEMPLDTEFYYITEGLDAPCIPADPVVLDLFDRVVAGNWGTATSGQLWSQITDAGNVPSVSGGVGNVLMDTAGDSTYMHIASPGPGVRGQVQFRSPVIATGALLNFEMIIRFIDVNNYISVQALLQTSGTIDLRFARRLGGVDALVGPTVNIGPYAAGEFINVVVEAQGSSYRTKAWRASSPEPGGWQIEVVNTEFPAASRAGLRFNPGLGNLNVPLTMVTDNFTLTSLCEPCTPVTADTSLAPTTIASGGIFRLRDPVRPCHDQQVPLCFTQANLAMDEDGYCIPGSGIFFASMDVEDYEPNTLTVNPTNAKYPLAMTRTRRGVSSLLTLVTRTFADRDALLTLAEPGSPLFWHGPAAYGIPDQYMNVGTVSVQRGLSDHKFQVRVNALPYGEVARPAGPTQGVCGSQVQDYCDFTWDELTADGNTWEDLIRGRPTGGTTGYRTWTIGASTVLALGTWNAVNNGRDWTELETGA